jgi:hypothetical protein
MSVELDLLVMIENSIITRYDGDLERHEDPREKRADTYIPLDTDAIRESLTTLWGEHITAQTLERVFETLTTDGAEKWPLAWCEEDLERERERRALMLDYEIECTEKQIAKTQRRLTKLTRERDQLIGEQFDKQYAQECNRSD